MSKVVLKLCKHPNSKPFLEEKLKRIPENYALMLTLALLRFDKYVASNTSFQKPFARVSVCLPHGKGMFWQVRLSNNEFAMSANAADETFVEKEARVIVTALNDEGDPEALASCLKTALEKHNSSLVLWSSMEFKKELSISANSCKEDEIEMYAAQLRDLAYMLQVAITRPLKKQEYAQTYANAKFFFSGEDRIKMMDVFLPPWFDGRNTKGVDFLVRLANVVDLDPTSNLVKLYKENVHLRNYATNVLKNLADFLDNWLTEKRRFLKISPLQKDKKLNKFSRNMSQINVDSNFFEVKASLNKTNLPEEGTSFERLSHELFPLPCQKLIGKIVDVILSCTDSLRVLFVGDVAMLEEEEVRQVQAFVFTDDSFWTKDFVSRIEDCGVIARVTIHRIFLHFDGKIVGVVTTLPKFMYENSAVERKCVKHIACAFSHVYVESPVFLIARWLADMMFIANEASVEIFRKEKLVHLRLMYRTLRVFYARITKICKNRLYVNGSERGKIFFNDYDSVFSFADKKVKLSSLCDVPYNEKMKKKNVLCDLNNSTSEEAFSHGKNWEKTLFFQAS